MPFQTYFRFCICLQTQILMLLLPVIIWLYTSTCTWALAIICPTLWENYNIVSVGRASAFPSERCWCTRSRPSSPVLTTAKFKKPHYDHKATGVKRKAKRIEKKKKIQVSDGISESPNLWTCRRKRNHVLIKPLESGLLIWESQNKFLTYI